MMRVIITLILLACLLVSISCSEEFVSGIVITHTHTRKKTRLYYDVQTQRVHWVIDKGCLIAKVYNIGDKTYRTITMTCNVASVKVITTEGTYHLK